MRFVKYYEWENEGTDRIYKGIAQFLEFGVNFVELDNGIGNYSTGIVELIDGTIKNVYVENIEFIEIKEKEI